MGAIMPVAVHIEKACFLAFLMIFTCQHQQKARSMKKLTICIGNAATTKQKSIKRALIMPLSEHRR
ncbi:hypothetical protein [Flexibacterium corallicola]|uniref:hypothetical protein n=1 Tax=Flexibacterium corallicola TaxID=3037259 RepID=UPI00286EB95E|nr:hypothetical protein [Pseudovibrio sp. M1P-2-3]